MAAAPNAKKKGGSGHWVNKRKPSTTSPNLSTPVNNGNATDGTPQSAIAPDVNTLIMKERMLFLLMGLVGSQCTATVKSGAQFQGILSSATTDGDLGICLSRVQQLDQQSNGATQGNDNIQTSVLIQGKDLVELAAGSIDLEEQTMPPAVPVQGEKGPATVADSFRTDTEITGAQESSDVRSLQRWSDEMEIAQELEPIVSNGNTAWDQFTTNEKLFGAKSNYDEEIYTTRLDRSGKDFKDRERKAGILAQQILSGSTGNIHIAEERNQEATSNGMLDEEDKYSGVIRGPNAYIPPAARRAVAEMQVQPPSLLASAVNGTSTSSETPGVDDKIPIAEVVNAGPLVGKGQEALLGQFRSFVSDEIKRLQPKRQTAVTKAKDDKLAELRSFSASFKLKMPVPADLVPLLAKDEKKQLELLSTSTQPKASHSQMPKPVPRSEARLQFKVGPSASTATTPQLKEAKIAGTRLASPASFAHQNKSTDGTSKTAAVQQSRLDLAEIPSFAELRAKKAAKEAQAEGVSKVKEWVNRTTSTAPTPPMATSSKINAAAKEFIPNPRASVFTPGVLSPARKSVELPGATPVIPSHPFFGTKTIKKGSPSMHVKEEFSPFRNTTLSDPASVCMCTPDGQIIKPECHLSSQPQHGNSQDVRSQSSAPLGIATTGSNNAQSNSGPSHALSPVSSHAISPGQGPYQMYYPPVAFQYRGQPTSMQHYPTGPIASSQPGNPQHIAFGPQQLIGQMPFSPNQPGMYSPQMANGPTPQFVPPNTFSASRHTSISGGPMAATNQNIPHQVYYHSAASASPQLVNRPEQFYRKMSLTPQNAQLPMMMSPISQAPSNSSMSFASQQ